MEYRLLAESGFKVRVLCRGPSAIYPDWHNGTSSPSAIRRRADSEALSRRTLAALPD